MKSSVLEHLRDDPIFFATSILGFKPFEYQKRLLLDTSKRIVSCMGRQTGKTTTIAIKAIHFAWANAKTTTLITSPSLRQSMIMFDRILDFVYSNPYLPSSVLRKTRTIIQLRAHSLILRQDFGLELH